MQQINEIESNPINYFEKISVDLNDLSIRFDSIRFVSYNVINYNRTKPISNIPDKQWYKE